MRKLNAAKVALEDMYNLRTNIEISTASPLCQEVAEYTNLLQQGFPTDPNEVIQSLIN